MIIKIHITLQLNLKNIHFKKHLIFFSILLFVQNFYL